MEQRRGDSVSSTEKEACDGSQTDFSVTNRLLPSGSSGITPPTHSKPAGIPTTLPGWHLLLPTDQGTVSSRHPIPAWQAAVPNVVLATSSSAIPPREKVRPPSNGVAPHHSNAQQNISTLYQAAIASASVGGMAPLHHVTNTAAYYGVGYGCTPFQQTAGPSAMPASVRIPADSLNHSSTGEKDTPQKVKDEDKDTNAEDEEEEDEDEDVEQSEDESDGESSQHSHSSPGHRDSIDEPKKPKRTRTAYSNYQLDQLEMWFQRCQYPDVFVREELSNTLGIREDRIQVWFQNRRARFRKQERTGSVSHRSRYRLRRIQKAMQDTRTSIPIHPTYAQYASPHSSPLVLPSPPPMPPPAFPQFPMPGQMPSTAAMPSLRHPMYSTLPGYQPRSCLPSTCTTTWNKM